jgi:hypothetical protein
MVWWFLNRLIMRLSHDTAVSFLGIYLKEENMSHKNVYIMFIAILLILDHRHTQTFINW